MDLEIVSIENEFVPFPTNEKFLKFAHIRFLVFWRDGFQCVYCGTSRAEAPKLQLNLDHVVPKRNGGGDTFDNLVTTCARCNAGKLDCELPERIHNLIQTIIKQNNERFLELADPRARERLEAAIDGQPLGRKRVTVRVDGDEYLVVRWCDGGSITLKGIQGDKAILFSRTRDPWTHELSPKDPNMIQLETMLAARGVHPDEIRGFDAEREEAFMINHRANMERYRKSREIYDVTYDARAAAPAGKAKNKRGARLKAKGNGDL
jgi:hypothetical protein